MTDAPGAPDPASPPALSPTGLDASGRPWPAFAHGSEAEMARILDFYAVRWDYEPRTFPILWNLDGDVVESFSPDFYLPELGIFLELTTLKQRLVRKKNRKLRRLRELYPDIRIKLFYARDFRAIMLKYGRLAFADGLSGTLGQVMPDRPTDLDPGLELEVAATLAEAADDEPGRSAGAPVVPLPAVPPAAAETSPEIVGPPATAPTPAAMTASAAASAADGARRPTSRARRRRVARAARAAAALQAIAALPPSPDPSHEEDAPPR